MDEGRIGQGSAGGCGLAAALTELARATRFAALGAEPVLLADRVAGRGADRDGAVVVRVGDTVAKAHAPDTDAALLRTRIRVAADPALAGILLPPLPPGAVIAMGNGRSPTVAATLWPSGAPVDPDDPAVAPWEEAGALLARLHAVPAPALARRLGGPLPAMRGPAKAVRAVTRMRATVTAEVGHARTHAAARRAVERVWAGLPAWCRAETAPPHVTGGALCHGDFHLGQLVRHPAPDGAWHLIDVDDLGCGEPAWDLARPAAWYAAGLLPAADWGRLLGSYQATAGTTGQDPWPELDAPARALTAQLAALALVRSTTARRPLDEDEVCLIDACVRIACLASGVTP